MPRQPRIDLPGIAQHVIQRGNDRQPCLFTDADCQRYRHLLQCARSIELNPVRAAMVPEPGHYPWSSHRDAALGWDDPLIRPHAAYRRLGATPGKRQAARRALVIEVVPPDETEAIRRHLQQQHAFGPDRFRQAIEAQLGRPCGPRRIGRPPRAPAPRHPHPETAL